MNNQIDRDLIKSLFFQAVGMFPEGKFSSIRNSEMREVINGLCSLERCSIDRVKIELNKYRNKEGQESPGIDYIIKGLEDGQKRD